MSRYAEVSENVEIVSATLENDGSVSVTYVVPQWLAEKYGTDTIRETISECLAAGAAELSKLSEPVPFAESVDEVAADLARRKRDTDMRLEASLRNAVSAVLSAFLQNSYYRVESVSGYQHTTYVTLVCDAYTGKEHRVSYTITVSESDKP